MKYNLKNRPKIIAEAHGWDCYEDDKIEKWFEGFEEELREIDDSWKKNKLNIHPDIVGYVRHAIKEILGE